MINLDEGELVVGLTMLAREEVVDDDDSAQGEDYEDQ